MSYVSYTLVIVVVLGGQLMSLHYVSVSFEGGSALELNIILSSNERSWNSYPDCNSWGWVGKKGEGGSFWAWCCSSRPIRFQNQEKHAELFINSCCCCYCSSPIDRNLAKVRTVPLSLARSLFLCLDCSHTTCSRKVGRNAPKRFIYQGCLKFQKTIEIAWQMFFIPVFLSLCVKFSMLTTHHFLKESSKIFNIREYYERALREFGATEPGKKFFLVGF